MDAHTRIATTFAFTNVSLEGHLTSLRRHAFRRAGARPIGELPQLEHGQEVRIGGLVVASQRPPTAKGYCFLAVEDLGGMVNVIVSPEVYARCRLAVRSAFVIVEGEVQKDHGAINLVAREVVAV